MRLGPWKLHLARDGIAMSALYDVAEDPGETRDRSDEYPTVVAELRSVAQRLRAALGDARLGITGTGCRTVGRVSQPRALTAHDPTRPYLIAEYDLADRG